MAEDDKNQEQDEPRRQFSGAGEMALHVLCFAISVGHIYVAFDPIISERTVRSPKTKRLSARLGGGPSSRA